MMLDWLAAKLKQKDGAHPLGTEAGLRDFLAGVPTAKPTHVLDEIGAWLGDPERLTAELSPVAFRRAVRSLDEFAQAAVDQAWTGLFAHADEDTAEDCWLPMGRYFAHAAAGYRAALQLFAPEAEITTAERSEFGLFALRAMTALAQRNKLLRMRYRGGGAEHWSAVHEVYRQARSRGVVATPYTTYSGARAGATVETRYLHALLFEAAPLDNLSARQMEVIDRFLRLVADQFVLREGFEERTPFLAAVQSAAPPVRWSPKAEPPADSRFFGPGLAMGDLYQALTSLQRGTMPEWLAAVPAGRDAALHALQLLRDCWSAEPPRRRFPRTQEQGELLSVHGFAQVRRMVAVSAFIRSGRKLSAFGSYTGRVRIQENYFGTVAEARTVAPQDPDANLTPEQMLQRLELAGDKDQMDRWQLADASLKGLGAIAPFHKQWQRVGALVGFRRDAAIHWEIGVIRRLGRNREGRRLVGIEVLPGVPAPVHVKPVNAAEAADVQVTPGALAEFGDGILVSTDAGTLLLPPGRHGMGDLLLVVGENLRLLVRLGVRLEGAADFDLYRYQAP